MTMKPPVNPAEIKRDYNSKKANFEKAFKEFHQQVFLNKKLDANKSTAVKNTELYIIDTLFKAAAELDNANVGQGLLALSSTIMRELLTMRDRVNELEYQLLTTIRDFKKLQKDLGVEDDKKK